MSTFYNGARRILYIKDNGVFKPVACLTSNSFQEQSEIIETTTLDNAGWKTAIPTNQGYAIEFSGIQIATWPGIGDTSKLSYDRLKAIKRAREIFDWEIRNLINLEVDFGQGFISSISEEANNDEFLSFSGQIVGYGRPIFSTGDSVTFDSTLITWDDTNVTFDQE